MPGFAWFGRGILTRGGGMQAQGSVATSSGVTLGGDGVLSLTSGGIDYGVSTSPSTATDLAFGSHNILITTSDGGYYLVDPPTAVGRSVRFWRQGTTATTSYLVPDTTTVHFYTSSGSTGGRIGTFSGGAGVELLAVSTAAWLPVAKWGNANFTSST